ncbi:hypothetical protein, variant 2 [Puccinia striiformis f. sp. tritici PST-78]|uniref:Uncharacterized protein n=1 Tax=Puccinia striiformis f. sp. tritici PST-78 TaxID=1165861 RepID=A0A0L0VIR5_9BASI|nr:hypothetical protein PSTG_07489 [Puccinia striiformis f. sp. tritici PST-78]KNE99179.1 hypothetical protein, variant 1 [Puccinia striiformis f. sp. tritici PST-78]KNE99180.1 hypothetical protein, variant 2 [Puccinia striiformis f. sp. tritici PST-78]
MDSETINAINYANLNKLSIGFLSIAVPLSSGLAGCLSYQFMNYLNTKMFLQAQAQNQLPNESRKMPSSLYHPHRCHFQEEPKQSGYGDQKKNHHIQPEAAVDQLENQKSEELDNRNLPHPSYTFNSNCQPDFFNYGLDNQPDTISDKHHWFRPLNIFEQQFGFMNDKFNIVVFFILVANLFSMALEVLVFKSLAHHTLVDTGLTRVYSWPLSTLLIVNYLISTGTRIYFARLASTMLRAPQMFLICSSFLLLISLAGLIFQTVLVGAHLIDYDQIRYIFTRNASEAQALRELINDLSEYFTIIGRHRIRLDLLQLAWLGPELVWDLLISAVLMFNVLDSRKRCRFGSLDGKISLGITIMFETMFLVTLATFVVLCICLVVGGKVDIDFERMNTLHAGFDGFVTKLHTISIFCSLQHKVNDRLRLEQKFILSAQQKLRDSTLNGYNLRQSVGSGDPNCHRRQSRKGSQAIQFPDFDETEVEASQVDGSDHADISDENDFDENSLDNNMGGENISANATENLRIDPITLTKNCHLNLSPQAKPNKVDPNNLIEDLAIQIPEHARIVNNHFFGRTSSLLSESLVCGPALNDIGLVPNMSLKKNDDPQELPDAYHPQPVPHHSHSNPNYEFPCTNPAPRPRTSAQSRNSKRSI